MISIRRTVTAASTLANILQGEIYEFLGQVTTIRAGIVIDATTAAPGDMTARFIVGNRVEVENFDVPVERDAGSGVDTDRDVRWSAVGRGGDRLVVSVTNNDGVTDHDVIFYANLV